MNFIYKYIFLTYFIIGSVFGSILEASYIYAGYVLLWEHGFSSILMMATSQAYFALLRTFLWLPSLVTWYVTLNDYSFLMWLAPGFYIEKIPR